MIHYERIRPSSNDGGLGQLRDLAKELFSVWPIRSTSAKNNTAETRWRLTAEEVTQVNLATVREGSSHPYWPTNVLMAFLSADVIKTTTH